ncbi:MAG: U32 family peptidase [Methanobacterium sp.]|uniref:U32 family peptidase n=1 Tax=Methanobacterium sp. TaxID=2164 RepID=UPI003D659FFA|nr:U32 family peptidase [Methanobacterium sp.]
MEIKIPELLAPAGSMDALKAAVNAGADAVYIAGKQFGARHYASNFSNEELKEATCYAHLRGVKIHVTVNTLVNDYELKKLAEYLIFLYKIGIDAILVQDVGVAKLAKELVPDLNLHASTQMTIHNLEGVKWASEFGFKRVVLAREMELSQIKKISENLKSCEIEIEIFAHGALCYSYSGQCLLSSLIGGRSGNRGMCAQPCRKTYELAYSAEDKYGRPVKLNKTKINEKYLLSTRDLSIYENLELIFKSSINSIKIEGRMRSPEYVAIVVSIYRKALDSIAKGKWKANKKDINHLKLAFNRDFTGGYLLEDNKNKVMGRNRPGNRGIYIGTVSSYNMKSKEVLIELMGDLIPQKGDGIAFIPSNKNEREYGMGIHEIPYIKKNKMKLKVQHNLKPGNSVYLTKSKSFGEKTQKIINYPPDKLKNAIFIDLYVSVEKDGSITLKSKFNGPKSAVQLEMSADFKMEKAINKPLNAETIENQFLKTGGTPFHINNIQIKYTGCFFTPISKINQLRRELFDKIEKKIISTYLPNENKIEKAYKNLNNLNKLLNKSIENISENKKPVDLAVYVDSLDTLNSAVKWVDMVYFDPFTINFPLNCKNNSKIDVEEFYSRIMEAISICKDNNTKICLKLPKITSDYFLNEIKPILTQSFADGIKGVMVDGIGAAQFILKLNPKIKLYGSSGLNIWNHQSIMELNCIFKSFTISPELSRDEIKVLLFNVREGKIKGKLELLVQGNLESIVSKDHIISIEENDIDTFTKMFWGLLDSKNHLFPLRFDTKCNTYILNSVELSLIDYMPQINNMGIDTVIIDSRGRTAEYTNKICFIYKQAIEIENYAKNKKGHLKNLKNEVKKISLGGITTGNFIRGVEKNKFIL